MNEKSLSNFKIPTLLGLAIIIFGISSGVFLVLQRQTTVSKAASEESPSAILITNLQDTTATISWKTKSKSVGLITYGVSTPKESTALDDRDTKKATDRFQHYVTLKNLSPETTYQFKIVSSPQINPLNFTTAPKSEIQNGFKPLIGTISLGEKAIEDGVVYLTAPDMYDQSALISTFGNFVIPLNATRTKDLKTIFQPSLNTIGTVKVVTEDGQLGSATINIENSDTLIPLKIGSNLDFTNLSTPTPAPQLQPEKIKFDLNGDGILNASDYSTILDNLGKNPKDKRADLNNDGVVDQKDLNLIQSQIEISSQ